MAKDNAKKKPKQDKNVQDKNRCVMCDTKNAQQDQKSQKNSFE